MLWVLNEQSQCGSSNEPAFLVHTAYVFGGEIISVLETVSCCTSIDQSECGEGGWKHGPYIDIGNIGSM